MIHYFVLLMGIFLIGCEDRPYKEEQSIREKEYIISGTAELGNPISSATISVHEFKNLKEGKKLAETTTNLNGSFEAKLHTSYEGPVLLKANGGSYKDLLTQENIPLKPKQELKTLLTDITMQESSNINAWTTLAVARVIADRGFWDPTIRQLSHIDRINVDFFHVSKLLAGKSTNFINIRQQKSLDSADNLSTDNSKALFFLSHGGFSQLAKNFSERMDGYSITALDIILALAEDLSDRVFDGKNAAGQIIQIGKIQRINLNSQTMRKDFAEALLIFIRNINDEKMRNNLEVLKQIAVDIASDEMPELFPEKEKPKPIDITPPKIFITFKGVYDSENPFAIMEGDVSFYARATDDTKLEKIEAISPKISFSKEHGTLGPIGVDYIHDARAVANDCNKQDELYKNLQERQLNPNDVVCACFEASDVFGNSQRNLSCFQREVPKAEINFPTANRLITSKDFSNGISIKAKVKSGVALSNCNWKIVNSSQIETEPSQGLKGEGTIDSNICSIDAPLSQDKFSNGSYFFIIYAKDLYGREISFAKFKDDKNVIPFDVAIVPPAVELLSPQNGDFLSGQTIKFIGSFTEANKIKSITVSYKGLSDININNNGSFDVPLGSQTNIWRAELGFNLPQGEYEVTLTVIDIFGNQRSALPRKINIDTVSPNIKEKILHLDTRMIGYKQFYFNRNESSSKDMVKPNFSAQLGQKGSLNETRWSTEIDEEEAATRFEFITNDENGIKEVRYGIDTTCASWEQAKKITKERGGFYLIKILQKNTRANLLKNDELCLTVLASDFAGNIARYDKKIAWHIEIPPVSVHLNPAYFLKNRVSLSNRLIEDSYLKSNTEIGYAVLTNQFDRYLTVSLELTKPMIITWISAVVGELLINNVSPEDIYIQYFKYDPERDVIGERLYGEMVSINPKSSIVAKFITQKKIKYVSKTEIDWVFPRSLYPIKFPTGYSDIQLTVLDNQVKRSAIHPVYSPPYQLNQGEN